jgi:hypothetical protein
VAHGRQPCRRQQGLLRIVQDDEDLFITAKGGVVSLDSVDERATQ